MKQAHQQCQTINLIRCKLNNRKVVNLIQVKLIDFLNKCKPHITHI